MFWNVAQASVKPSLRIVQGRRVVVSYHSERHAVNLVLVFGLVLSEWTVPGQRRKTTVT